MCKTDQLLLHNFRIWKMVDTGWEAAYEKNAVLHTGCHHADGVVGVRAEAGGDKKALGGDGGFLLRWHELPGGNDCQAHGAGKSRTDGGA